MDNELLLIIINDLLNRLIMEKTILENQKNDIELKINDLNNDINQLLNYKKLLNNNE